VEQVALILLSIALASSAIWLLVKKPKPVPASTPGAHADGTPPEAAVQEVTRDPEGEAEALDQRAAATGQISLDIEVEMDEDEPTSPVALILVMAYGSTDVGLRRSHNEDSILTFRDELFAIADGMGGYAAGEVASELCTEVMTAAFGTGHFGGAPDGSLPRRGDELVRAIKCANREIYEKASEDSAKTGMGTTVVAARFSPNKKRVYVAHVGDSRCYRLQRGALEQLTSDHTLGSLGMTGRNAEKLIRALGVQPEVDVDLRVDVCEDGDLFLLCSDGLSKMVPDAEIVEILSKPAALDQTVNDLIAAANAHGGRDNVSVILARIQDAAEAVAAMR